MREEIFCVAKNPFQAKGIITRIRALGIPPNNVVVASRPSEVEETSRPGSRIFHDAKFGFAAGVAAGVVLRALGARVLIAAAVWMTIGFSFYLYHRQTYSKKIVESLV